MTNQLTSALRLNGAGRVVTTKSSDRRFKIRYFLRPEYAEQFRKNNPDKEPPEKIEDFTGTLKEVRDRAFHAVFALASEQARRITYEITGEYAKGWKIV